MSLAYNGFRWRYIMRRKVNDYIRIEDLKYTLLIILSFFIKVSYFNISTGTPLDKLKYVFVTVGVFFCLLLAFYRFRKSYIFLNIFLTLIMFGDVLYFRYFNDFLSVKLMNQATYAGSVSEIIFSITRFTDFILFIDVIAYFAISKKVERLQIFRGKLAFILTLIILPTVLISVSFASVYTGIKKYEFFNYHVYDIIAFDLANSTFTSEDEAVLIAQLEAKQQAIEEETRKYFGIAKDKNLIVVQIESLQTAVVNQYYHGQEITPNINKLISKDSIYFSNYYQQLGKGNTSDAEFVSLNSLYPITTGNTYNVYERNSFYGLPWIMREHGYTANSYHGYVASFWNRENIYPKIGFEESYFEHHYVMGEKIVFGLADEDFFKQTAPIMAEKEGKNFHFLVTLSSHKPYNLPEDKKKIVLDEADENFFGHYIQSINYLDYSIGVFIESLKEQGLYEDSVIVMYGDHFGIGMEDKLAKERMEAFLGTTYTHEEMFNIPLWIHIPNSNIAETVSITGGQIDFVPTILNIMGIENNYLTFGQDLLNAKDGFVASQTFMNKGSFIDNEKVFVISREGKFEESYAYHRDTHEPIDIELCREGYERAILEIDLSKKVTETNSTVEVVLNQMQWDPAIDIN